MVQDRVGGENRGSRSLVDLRGGGSGSVPNSSWGTRVSASAGRSQESSLGRGCGLGPSPESGAPFLVQRTGPALLDASNGILALRPAANSLARRTGGTVVLDESLEFQLETPITEELEGEPPGTTAPA